MNAEPYAVVIGHPRHPRRLRLAVRRSPSIIEHLPLETLDPYYDEARAEAQRKLPGHLIVVPRQGDKIP